MIGNCVVNLFNFQKSGKKLPPAMYMFETDRRLKNVFYNLIYLIGKSNVSYVYLKVNC